MKITNLLISIFILTLSLWSTGHFAHSTYEEVSNRYVLLNHPPLSSIDRRVTNTILLGQTELYDDFIHLWTTQYLGSEELLEYSPEVVLKELEKILPLQIKSESFYLLSCFRFIFHFKRPELCEPIGKAGMNALPENWMIPATLGYAYLIQKSFSEAAIFFEATGMRPGAPEYFKTVGKKILDKNNVDFSVPGEILKEFEKSETTQKIIKKLSN